MHRLLYIAHRLPYPPDKGERLRALHFLRGLAKQYEVTLLALCHSDDDEANTPQLRQWCKRIITARAGGKRGVLRGGLSLVAGRSLTEGYFHSRRLRRAVDQMDAAEPFDVAFGYCSSVLPYLLAAPAKRRVLDLVDVDSLKWRSYAQVAPWPKSRLFAIEADRVEALERRVVETCEAVLLVSQPEVDAFHARADNVHALPNGVDTDYFDPDTVEPADLGPQAVVFTGTMDYPPNVEGVCWFARDIWPAVRRRHPQATFTIVGRDPASEVRKLAQAPGVTVTGGVPDVRPYLAGARLAVCPLLTARGIQNKILEALAMARPVVATPAAMEGIDLARADCAAVAENADDWISRLNHWLAEDTLMAQLGRAAREQILADFDWSARQQRLGELVAAAPSLQTNPASTGLAGAPARLGQEALS